MNKKETDLVVSILNLVAEDMGWDVSEEGFGYDPETLKIDVVSECDLHEALADLWDEYRDDYNQRNP